MTSARRGLAPFALVATLALPLAACGSDDGPTSTAGTPTASEQTSAPEALDRPAQQRVRAATARKALPTLEDLPKGWSVNESPVSHSTRTYDPPQCAAVEMTSPAAQDFKDAHLEVEERVAYSEWTEGIAAQLIVSLHSYSEPVPFSFLEDAGSHLGECGTYRRTIDGDEQIWKAEALTTPTVGDRALAIRYTAEGSSGRMTDQLAVRSGHNLLTVKYVPSDPTYDDQLLEDYAQDVLDRLEELA